VPSSELLEEPTDDLGIDPKRRLADPYLPMMVDSLFDPKCRSAAAHSCRWRASGRRRFDPVF